MHQTHAEPEQQAPDDRGSAELAARDPEGGAAHHQDRREQQAGDEEARPRRESGGIVSTAILIPKYVEPHTT